MRRIRLFVLCLAIPCALPAANETQAADRAYRMASANYNPYVDSYLDGYRYVPWPIDTGFTHGAKHRVPVYMYGYFGARKRQEPTINQGYNEYIRNCRRGYNW